MDDASHEAGESAARGFALLSRGMPEHGVVGFGRPGRPADPARGCFSHAEAWLDLILMAAYRSRKVSTGKSCITIERGEVLAPERELAHRWNWTYKAVRLFVTKLRAQNMVERGARKGAEKGARVSILTICNYDKFQTVPGDEGRTEGRTEGRKTSQKGAQNSPISGKKYNNKYIPPYSPPTGVETEEPGLFGAEPIAQPVQAPEPQRQAPSDIEAGFEAWARVAADFGLPACKSASEARRKRMARRLKVVGGAEAFEAVLRREIGASAFLRGKRAPRPGQKPFRADVDFVLQDKSWDRLCDGFYSDPKTSSTPPPKPTNATACDAHPLAERAAEMGMTVEDYEAALDRARAAGRVRTGPIHQRAGQFMVDFVNGAQNTQTTGGHHDDAF